MKQVNDQNQVVVTVIIRFGFAGAVNAGGLAGGAVGAGGSLTLHAS